MVGRVNWICALIIIEENNKTIIAVRFNNLEIKKVETEEKLADPKIYNDSKALADVNRSYTDIKQKLDQSTETWETLMLEVDILAGK